MSEEEKKTITVEQVASMGVEEFKKLYTQIAEYDENSEEENPSDNLSDEAVEFVVERYYQLEEQAERNAFKDAGVDLKYNYTMQRDDNTCGHACVAMLLNKEYVDVVADFVTAKITTKKVPGSKTKGIMFIDICAYLNGLGIATKTKKLHNQKLDVSLADALTDYSSEQTYLLVVGNKKLKHFILLQNEMVYDPENGIMSIEDYIEFNNKSDVGVAFSDVFYAITIG